jgi:isopentenyldiphosphate isomerase
MMAFPTEWKNKICSKPPTSRYIMIYPIYNL